MTQLGNFVWSIADQLRGVYKPAQYGSVVLPFTILRRMECVLDTHRDKIQTVIASTPNEGALAAKLRRDYDLHFWNRSPHTLKSLLGDPENLADGLIDYVSQFSSNVADIFERYGFEKTLRKLEDNDRLYLVVQQFADADMHPSTVSNAVMGSVFEDLIRRFAEASNETAGEHFTPRDAIRLMVDLLLHPDSEMLTQPGAVRTIYDPTAGTGGMLSVAEERIFELNPKAKVTLSGQEINDESYAICKSDMIGQGQAVDAIAIGDTLRNDQFAGKTFDYCLCNPPYGVDWRAAEPVIRKEYEHKGGRFDAGLPRISDGQLLFLQHLVSKMRPAVAGESNSGGRAAIVLNGSPLFSGGAGSGESEIRRWLLESDLVDAIVALPTNMFYNTGIATYVWLLDNNKTGQRKGKIQLIDGTSFWAKLRKNLGSKNRELSEEDRTAIATLYANFEENDHSKILEPADFGYTEITVEQPLKLRFEVQKDRIDEYLALKPLAKLDTSDRDALRTALTSLVGQVFVNRTTFRDALGHAVRDAGTLLGLPLYKALINAIGEHDDDADVCLDEGKPEPDPSLRDTELVPFRDDIQAYVERDVKPYVPGAWIDDSKTRVGYEIPFTRLFYRYDPPRPLTEIDVELNKLALEIIDLLQVVER
ncbi:MAG: type I restriction-modification system subunit M [Propionibacteriaceae bacterium]